MQGRSVRRLTAIVLATALGLAPVVAARPARAAEFGSHLQGDTVLVLAAGERVTVRLAPDGKLAIANIQAANPQDAGPPKPGSRPKNDTAPFIEAPAGTLAFTLGGDDQAGLLKVENGGALAFDYQAWIPHPGGPLEPTSVCTVLPLLAGYEQWPKRHLSRLVLDRFTPRATNSVDCPQPSGPPPAVPTP